MAVTVNYNEGENFKKEIQSTGITHIILSMTNPLVRRSCKETA